MRLGNALFLLRKHWRFHWASWLIVALLVAVSAFVIALIGGATRAVNAALREWSSDIFPPTVLTVRPATEDFSLFGFQLAVPQTQIMRETIDQIAVMPEVERLFPVVVLTFPTHAEATFMGEGFGTDAVVAGIDLPLVRSELASPEQFVPVDWLGGQRVPVLLSSYFVDLYNLMYAQTISAPALSEQTVLGFEFDLSIGESVLGGSLARGPRSRVRCRIVGLTRNPQLLGVTIPRQTVEEMRRWYEERTGIRPTSACSYAFVEIGDTGQIDSLRERLAVMDLLAESPPHVGRLSTLERLLSLTSAVLQAVILGLTLFGCFCLMALQMENRRPSLVFLHVSGVPGPIIRRLMVGEAGIVVAIASALGTVAALVLLNRSLVALTRILPVSVPTPELTPLMMVLTGAVTLALLIGAVTLVAVAVVAAQLRGVGRRPVE
ncbi:hypothetical protein JXA47_11400 [Candidatus Sumerlaeota bacterium]|nr:hypothetical protein [Candidatus Sumerlaeota bacterium]